MRIWDLLQRSDRQALVHEDSSRQGVQINARSDKTLNGAYIVIKTVGPNKDHPHYHSFTLFKEPDQGWQIFLWHVGG